MHAHADGQHENLMPLDLTEGWAQTVIIESDHWTLTLVTEKKLVSAAATNKYIHLYSP